LIPRPDSETVIEAACRARPDRTAALRILDLGTGTGCLLLALLREYPHAVGVGVDLSPLAVETARENAQALGMEARARFMPLDWNDRADPLYANLYAARFDIIVSNPPYIATGEIETLMRDVLDYEPRVSMDLMPTVGSCLSSALPWPNRVWRFSNAGIARPASL